MTKKVKKVTNDELLAELRGLRKIVINGCYGGFSLSSKGEELYLNYSKIPDKDFWVGDIARDDPLLIRVIEELGEEANGDHAGLRIVKIPANVKWHIAEYDGIEHVAEDHRKWY